MASDLEQLCKSLKAELLEVRQRCETPSVAVRNDQAVDRKSLSEIPNSNHGPTPRSVGGQSVDTWVSPPTLTVNERQEIERLAAALMATLVRLEGYKVRSVDIASVTGIANGWKRTIEHLVGIGQVAFHKEFLCISDVEKIRRGLK